MSDSSPNLREQIPEEMKAAMKAGDKDRLATIRLIMAAIKQKEVDERITLGHEDVLAVLDKMAKQRRESIAQYEKANREDLAAKERAELEILLSYLPKALETSEIDALIDEALSSTGASSMKDMGKVMGFLKPKIQGRADMSQVSAQIKAKLQ